LKKNGGFQKKKLLTAGNLVGMIATRKHHVGKIHNDIGMLIQMVLPQYALVFPNEMTVTVIHTKILLRLLICLNGLEPCKTIAYVNHKISGSQDKTKTHMYTN